MKQKLTVVVAVGDVEGGKDPVLVAGTTAVAGVRRVGTDSRAGLVSSLAARAGLGTGVTALSGGGGGSLAASVVLGKGEGGEGGEGEENRGNAHCVDS